MTNWKTVRIDQLGRVVTGKTPSSKHPEEFGDEYPFVTPSDIPATQKYVPSERYLSERGMEVHRRIQLPKKAICVVCIGATIGKVCMTDRPSISNQQINSVIPSKDESDADFVYYLSTTLRDSLIAFSGGAATPIVNKSTFSAIKLLVPGFHVQQKIAAILSAYDELIENNKRRIALLEKMADEIYREWFVRLRFPGNEKVRIIKGVPEGWSFKKLGELVNTQYGYTASAQMEEEGPKFLRITDIVPAAIDWESVPRCKIDEKDEERYLLSEGDIVVARTGATVGYAKRIGKSHPKAIFASYLVRLVPKRKIDATFLGLSVERNAFKDFIWMFITGAAQPQANATTMALFPLMYPSESLLNEFNRIVAPILERKELLLNQILVLSRARDFLLPRLISGKLSVENLNIQFPPGMAKELNAEPAAPVHA